MSDSDIAITFTPTDYIDRTTTVYGLTFTAGVTQTRSRWPQLRQKDPDGNFLTVDGKLRGNPQFTVEVGGKVFHAVAQAEEQTPEVDPRDAVDIPEDWASLHWKQRQTLAKAVAPAQADKINTADEADAVLREELIRRGVIEVD